MDTARALAGISKIISLQQREECEQSLLAFSKYVWPVVEPAIDMVQGWALEAICDHLEAVERGDITRLLINVPPGFSKALTHDTPVLTTWGWKRHGELQPGDFIFGPDGKPKRIIACSDEMDKEAYRVEFDDGAAIVAGEDHQWEVERQFASVPPHYGNGKKRVIVRTDDLRPPGIMKGKVRGRPDTITVCDPVEFPPRNLLVEPYVLGCWLGDGYSKGGNLGVAHLDLHHFIKLGRIGTTYPAGLAGRKQAFYRLTIDGLHAKLRALNLLLNKHIPEEYLTASIEQRWELLRGLMDTDGWATKEGHCSFSNKNKPLAESVQRLCQSLGLKAWRRPYRAKLNGRDYGEHWLVGFTPPVGTKIFHLERKQSRVRFNQNQRSRRRWVTAVIPVGKRKMKCIQVEGGFYLVGEALIKTHNSLLSDVFFPAWIWGPRNRPWTRFLCAAYGEHLTVRDNMRCRNIIVSERYQKLWKGRFKVSGDQFTKINFANDKTGWKMATSVGGGVTGHRADIVVVDDPNNPMEMESEAIRESTKIWFTEILPDRLNNQEKSAIVIIQQRTHEEDVSGIAIAREMGYEHLMIPMYYDPGRHCTTILGWSDPRAEEGELAWAERFPLKVCEDLRRDKGPHAWAGQYQQSPEPRGGAIIKRDWWQNWKGEKYPPFEFVLASLDTAFTEKEENDACALTVWGVFREDASLPEDGLVGSEALWMRRDGRTAIRPREGNPKVMLIYAWQDRMEFYDLIEKVIATCIPNPANKGIPSFPVDKLLIEAKANGLSVGQELHRMFRGSGKFGLDLINPTQYGDKVARVHAVQHLFADNMIYAPDRAFADLVINQCAVFPRGARDDLVDTVSMALRYLRDAGFALRREEQALVAQEELEFVGASARLPLYPV